MSPLLIVLPLSEIMPLLVHPLHVLLDGILLSLEIIILQLLHHHHKYDDVVIMVSILLTMIVYSVM